MGFAAETLYIHSQISSLGDKYTSFCNVNESVNCDQVLSSAFGTLAGLPIGVYAVATYLAIGVLFWMARSRAGTPGVAWPLRLACAGVLGSVAFSVYMAGVSVFILETICLMCTGLYVVAALLLGVSLAAGKAHRTAWPNLPGPLENRQMFGTFAGSSVVVAAIAAASWPTPQDLPIQVTTAAQVKAADPDFFNWYSALPEVPEGISLHRADFDPAAHKDQVVIVEFSDFQCGHCRANHALMKDFLARRGDDVVVHHRNFPLDSACNDAIKSLIHAHACRAAEAAECAAAQGLYDEMADYLFENQTQLFEQNLFRLAGKAGVEMAAFEECMEKRTMLPVVVEDARVGNVLEITSTPTVFINRTRVKGAIRGAQHYYDFAIVLAKDPGLRAGAGASAN